MKQTIALIALTAALTTAAHASDAAGQPGPFDGMKPEQIVRHLANCNGPASEAAAAALAAHGESVLPLIRKVLKDTHPMMRRGALLTLKHMYQSDREDFIYAEFPPKLSKLLAEVRPMAGDPSSEVRSAVGQLAVSFKMQNEDVYEILYEMARHGDADAISIARYNITDPVARTRMTILRTAFGHSKKEVVPQDYDLFLVTTAHLEIMQEAIPLCLDMVKSEKVWNLYGMGSHLMLRNAFTILGQFARDDPRVLENLNDILYVSERVPNRIDNWYFYHMNSGPRAIVLKLGLPALPVLERFLKDLNIKDRAYSLRKPIPEEWWDEKRHGASHRMHDWLTTIELMRCLHGQIAEKDAVEILARIYIDRHYWDSSERMMILDFLLKSDPALIPLWRAAAVDEAKAVDKKLDELHKSLLAVGNTRIGNGMPLKQEAVALRLDDIDIVAGIIQAGGAKPPTKEDVEALAAFVMRREWADTGPAGPLWIGTKAFARDTLVRWGAAAEPHIAAYAKAQGPATQARINYLGERLRHWETQRYRYAVNHLARIPLEKLDTLDAPVKLEDIAHIIRCTNKVKLSDEDTARLCRILTRRNWPSQDAAILAALKKGSQAVILKHITDEEDALPSIIKKKNEFIAMTVRGRFRWQYERYKAIEANIRKGVELLKGE